MNYYGNAECFRKYLADRGKTLNVSSNAEIEAALLVASEWIDSQYESKFVGYKTGGYNQVRSWPRTSAIVSVYPYPLLDKNTIPMKVVHACYEAAFRHITQPDILLPDFKRSKYKYVTINGALSVQYDETLTTASDSRTEFPIIESLLSDFVDPNSTSELSGMVGKSVRV